MVIFFFRSGRSGSIQKSATHHRYNSMQGPAKPAEDEYQLSFPPHSRYEGQETSEQARKNCTTLLLSLRGAA